MSTGAKAGIGVGAAIGGLILFGGLGFLIYRVGKAAGRRGDNAVHGNDVGAAELGSDPKPKPELGGNAIHEVSTGANAAEMGDGHHGNVGYDECQNFQHDPAELSAEPYQGHQTEKGLD